MLDKRSRFALRYFVDQCSEGGYKILETDDIIASLPKNFKVDEQGVAQIVKYLENGEYISVKYADGHEYCLCPLPFGRQFVENIDQAEKQKKQSKYLSIKTGIITFMGAFFGAIVGTLVYYLF